MEERYSSLQEEVQGKTRKLRKVWTLLHSAKSEVEDLRQVRNAVEPSRMRVHYTAVDPFDHDQNSLHQVSVDCLALAELTWTLGYVRLWQEHQHQMESLLQGVRQLTQELKLSTLIVDEYIPAQYQVPSWLHDHLFIADHKLYYYHYRLKSSCRALLAKKARESNP